MDKPTFAQTLSGINHTIALRLKGGQNFLEMFAFDYFPTVPRVGETLTVGAGVNPEDEVKSYRVVGVEYLYEPSVDFSGGGSKLRYGGAIILTVEREGV